MKNVARVLFDGTFHLRWGTWDMVVPYGLISGRIRMDNLMRRIQNPIREHSRIKRRRDLTAPPPVSLHPEAKHNPIE